MAIKEINPLDERKKSPWIRGFYMLVFMVIYNLVEVAIFFTALFQFGHNLLLGQPQQNLLELGKKMSEYNYHIYLFLTFNTEQRPYPFNEE